jgi:CRP-like cAMP-binding protein
MNKQLIDYLGLNGSIPPSDGASISSCFEERQFREGDFLFREGKVCRELFFICEGVVRIVSTSDKGLERTHFFYAENKFCTILQSFEEEITAVASIRACCNTRVLVIGKPALSQLYRQLPRFREMMGQLQQAQLIEKVNVRSTYLGLDMEEQYRLFVKENPAIASRVSQKDVASFLGITPQSLSRIRKQIR